MTDLSTVLPDFPVQAFVRLIPSLERNLVTTIDLITLDAVEIAKRARLPTLDVRLLCEAVLLALQGPFETEDASDKERELSLKQSSANIVPRWSTIRTLDESIDAALGGGVPTGYITEVTGER